MGIHHTILHHIRRYHKLRKLKDEVLPPWKQKIHDFNDKYFRWFEKLVEGSIPWLLVVFLFVLFAEAAGIINFFKWGWLTSVANFAKDYQVWLSMVDNVIVAFFAIDLYFSFFKKARLWTFLKHYFLDIIAIFPFGLFIRAEVGVVQETQSALHFIGETEKEVSRLSMVERVGASVGKVISGAGKFARSLRIYRLIDFFKLKRKKTKDRHNKRKHHKKK